MSAFDLRLGDCVDGLASLADGSVDAMVTDPPSGTGFMGREWDSDRGGRVSWIAWLESVMREALRVMKPGAHGLVWALPRTSHWTATACEQAGFEVRDVITHQFGTGFPKSLDVSKAIDEAAGAKREVVGSKLGRPGMAKDGSNQTFNALRAMEGREDRPNAAVDVTAPATDAAKQWDGWGTALKPATEHWILVRKPLAGTVAANVLAHRTGGLNVDACRIGTGEDKGIWPQTERSDERQSMSGPMKAALTDTTEGRWPANLVLSHTEWCEDGACLPGCPVAILDAQAGVRRSGAMKAGTPRGENAILGKGGGGAATAHDIVSSEGGASRFFYVAKPTTAEREADLGLMPRRRAAELTGSKEGQARLDSPRTGAGRTSKGRANIHPTVKSIALMSWLVRLVTPPGGLVLDPFAGSGSTGVAALRGGFRFVGWERDPDYHRVAEARIAAAVDGPLFARAAV